jgi:hypothetical protein
MKRFLNRMIFCVVPAALAAVVLGVPTAAPDLGLQNVNLSCNDSTNLALVLDATTVTQLSDAVSAISLFPAGDPALACSLTQSAALTSSATRTFSSWRTFSSTSSGNGNGPDDFAVGGGRIFVSFFGCDENFAVNGHVPADTPYTPGQAGAHGTVNLTVPGTPSATCNTRGSLVTKVDCVQVSGNTADMTSEVTKSSGLFLTSYPVGTEVAWHIEDLSPTAPDEFGGSEPRPPAAQCTVTTNSFPVVEGNITVHNN